MNKEAKDFKNTEHKAGLLTIRALFGKIGFRYGIFAMTTVDNFRPYSSYGKKKQLQQKKTTTGKTLPMLSEEEWTSLVRQALRASGL